MELLIIMATIAVICRDPAGTIKAATSYKRAQIERERARNPKVRHPGHRALRNYLGTVWEAQWNDAAERYPEQMRAARERREARRAHKDRQAKDRQAKEKEGRGPEPTPPAPAPEPAPAPVPAGVVDLDAERRRRAGTEPEAGTDPAAPEEGMSMPINLSDATSLRAHLAALREHASYQDRTCTAKEQLAAGMRESGVGDSTVAAVDASRAASAHAAAMARAAADALEAANMQVAEARAGSPDAADGDYYERR